MTTIAQALSELGIKEWVLRGDPTTEDEFNAMFRKVTGSDAMVQPSKVQPQRTLAQHGKLFLIKRQN